MAEMEWTAEELRRHDPRMLLQAVWALRRFSSRDWITSVDVPTAVLATRQPEAFVSCSLKACAEVARS
jgi:hypothetical protein